MRQHRSRAHDGRFQLGDPPHGIVSLTFSALRTLSLTSTTFLRRTGCRVCDRDPLVKHRGLDSSLATRFGPTFVNSNATSCVEQIATPTQRTTFFPQRCQ
jgi:hypothetical protein